MPPRLKSHERDLDLSDGLKLRLRPVRPEDKESLIDLVERMSPEDVRMRFHESTGTLSDSMAERLANVDQHHETAFVLVERNQADKAEIFGVVRVITDPKGEKGDYSVMVRSDMQGLGLGKYLMEQIIDHGRGRGIKDIVGEVTRANVSMLTLCDELGFTRRKSPNDLATVEVHLRL